MHGMGGNMQKNVVISIFCGLLFISGLNSFAAPIDQNDYLSNSDQFHLERRQKSWPDGSRYDGEWLQDKPHGQGMYTYADGAQYWGRFYLGKRQGEGMMKYGNGDEYEGSWFADKRNGKGKMRYATGAEYEGEFRDDAKSGKGRQTFVDGTYYDGQWLNNAPHGQGRLTFISGGAYEGEFHEGKPDGKGQYVYANGDIYQGDWHNGQQTGHGRLDYGTGGYYEGDFVDGKRQGKGIWVSALGARYEGTFADNEPNGAGRCGNQDSAQSCTYRNGKRVTGTHIASAAVAKTTVIAMAAPASAVTTTPHPAHPGSLPKEQPVAKPQPASPRQFQAAAKPAARPAIAKAPRPAGPAPTKAPAHPAPAATFVATLNKEKQQIKTMTIADLNQTRSDIYFSDNGQIQPSQIHPQRAWWKKRASLFQDQVEIISQHGNTKIRMLIRDYKGPGQYALDDVSVESPGRHFEKRDADQAKLNIKAEQNGWLSGTFTFQVSTKDGKQLDFTNGVFRVANENEQPHFLR